jgi:hypothetical protein
MEPNESDADRGALYQLQVAICLLASGAEVQIDYLERHGFGDCLDELALNLEAWFLAGETWEFHRILSREQIASLERVDGQLAREALQALGYEFEPDLREVLRRRWPASWVGAW